MDPPPSVPTPPDDRDSITPIIDHPISQVKKPRTTAPRYRAWCYTINNPSEREIIRLPEENAVVHVVGHEVGESGTFHLQGYIRFKTVRGLSWWKEHYPRAHAEPRKGTEAQAAEYCRKSGNMLFDTKNDTPEASQDSGKKRFQLAEEVMDEIASGQSIYAIHKRHRGFYFYNRSAILRYKGDCVLWAKDESATPDV